MSAQLRQCQAVGVAAGHRRADVVGGDDRLHHAVADQLPHQRFAPTAAPGADDADRHPRGERSVTRSTRPARGVRSASSITSSTIIALVAQISSTRTLSEDVALGTDAPRPQFGGDALPLVAQRQQLAVPRHGPLHVQPVRGEGRVEREPVAAALDVGQGRRGRRSPPAADARRPRWAETNPTRTGPPATCSAPVSIDMRQGWPRSHSRRLPHPGD